MRYILTLIWNNCCLITSVSWSLLFFLFYWRFFRFFITLTVILILALFLVFWFIVLTYSNKGLISLFISFFKRLNTPHRNKAVQKLFRSTRNAYKLVLHGLNRLQNFFPLQWISQISNNKNKVFFLNVSSNLDIILLFRLIFFKQFTLHILK